jgi:hypothetical protein
MKVICSTVNKFRDAHCEECKHGKPHEPITGAISHFRNGKTKKIPCNETTGRCYIGLNMEWDCTCIPLKKGRKNRLTGKPKPDTFTLINESISHG